MRTETLDDALAAIATGAAARDAERQPEFPVEPFLMLERAGALSFNSRPGEQRPPAAAELSLVRRVAAADGSVGRIFDGHLNAVERVAVQAPDWLRERELAAVRAGELLAGVWGGDPVGDEGPAATVISAGDGEVLRGVKTFCSGAGGLQRALVLGRGPDGGPPISVWVDVSDRSRVEIDERWSRARGLVASVSHRVIFHDAPVIAPIGLPGAISAHPWFGRDALRTAATWAGMADTAVPRGRRSRKSGGAARPQSAGGIGGGPHPDRAEHDRRLALVCRRRPGPGRSGSGRHGSACTGRDRRGLPRAACRGSAGVWLEALRVRADTR